MEGDDDQNGSKRLQTRRLDPIGVCFFSIHISLILTNNLWHIQLITYDLATKYMAGRQVEGGDDLNGSKRH